MPGSRLGWPLDHLPRRMSWLWGAALLPLVDSTGGVAHWRARCRQRRWPLPDPTLDRRPEAPGPTNPDGAFASAESLLLGV